MTAARKLPEPMMLALDKIRLDGGTQWRKRLDDEHLERLSANVGDLPPLLVFWDGESYWLVDGFHRYEVLTRAERKKFLCIVRDGSLEDARWESFGTNAAHDKNGKPLSNAEKREAVIAALKHPKGEKLSTRSLAEHVGVSHTFINDILEGRRAPTERILRRMPAESRLRWGSGYVQSVEEEPRSAASWR